jgi:hypothetical protein
MAAAAQKTHTETVRAMPSAERLAALILDELTHHPDTALVEYSSAWSEQDQSDLTAFSLQYAASAYPE